MSDGAVRAEDLLLTLLIVCWALAYTIGRLRRRRPDFNIGLPIAVGVGLRLLAVAAINATGSLQSDLRGGDEQTFLALARSLASTPWGSGFLPHGPYQLQTVVFAGQLKLADVSTTTLRVTQIGIATLGVILILAAVYDLAGDRPGRLAGWLLAFEPASIFFNSEIHKEPLMVLASGLVVFGATKIWQRLDFYGVILAGLGALVAIETRAYAGWFLVGATVLLLLHAAMRRLDRPGRALPVLYAIAVAAFLVTPTLLSISSNTNLQALNRSQAYTTGQQAATNTGGANSDNLADESVDFSTRGAVITSLPKRVFDLVLRPFPWQLQDPSQQLGAVGSMAALTVMFLLLGYAWKSRGHVLAATAPILYPLVFLLIAYSLSAGNAGTGFRYRTHLVVLGVAMVVVLRERLLHARAETPELAFSAPQAAPRPFDSTVLGV